MPPSDDTTSSVSDPVVSSPPIAPSLLLTIEESPLTQFTPNLLCLTQDRRQFNMGPGVQSDELAHYFADFKYTPRRASSQ